jgi:hypothetical protein
MTSSAKPRVQAHILRADRKVFFRLQILEGYSPINSAASLEILQQLAAVMERAEKAKVIARRQYEQTIEEASAAQEAFHRAILAAKEQVVAQYGSDSLALHAIGRKLKSERKRPARRAKASE